MGGGGVKEEWRSQTQKLNPNAHKISNKQKDLILSEYSETASWILAYKKQSMWIELSRGFKSFSYKNFQNSRYSDLYLELI